MSKDSMETIYSVYILTQFSVYSSYMTKDSMDTVDSTRINWATLRCPPGPQPRSLIRIYDNHCPNFKAEVRCQVPGSKCTRMSLPRPRSEHRHPWISMHSMESMDSMNVHGSSEAKDSMGCVNVQGFHGIYRCPRIPWRLSILSIF